MTEGHYNTPERKPYQQFIFKATDEEDKPVPDYTIEFFMVQNPSGGATAQRESRNQGLEEENPKERSQY